MSLTALAAARSASTRLAAPVTSTVLTRMNAAATALEEK